MDDTKRMELVLKLRGIAGEIGSIDNEQPLSSDADSYDLQVLSGLSDAVVTILDDVPSKFFSWIDYCLISYGLGFPNPRITALIDALENEVYSQLESLEEDETSAE
jgi:hypothetical protein